MKILWISRHVPQPAQVAALENKFGDNVTILVPTDNLSTPVWAEWDGTQQVVGFILPPPNEASILICALLSETGADEIVGVIHASAASGGADAGRHPATSRRYGARPDRTHSGQRRGGIPL